MMRISAVICTHNRAHYLSKAIESLINQSFSAEAYEILVIDNCSNDTTREVSKRYSNVPNFRYIFEKCLGLSFARNKAISVSKGDIVAYLDDDAIACRDWMKEIDHSFRQKNRNITCVGGKVKPIWECPKPLWIDDRMIGQLSMLDFGDQIKILKPNERLVGANMAFLKNILVQLNGFSTNLGRKGNNLLSMEEVDLINRMRELGGECLYNPAILVTHHVPKERLTQRWFLKRAIGQGESDAEIYISNNTPSKKKRFLISLRTFIGILLNINDLRAMLFPTKNPWVFSQKCSVYARLSHIKRLIHRKHG